MTQFKLANVILGLDDHIRCYPEMMYRTSGAVDLSAEDGSLAFDSRIDFLTYFNALSSRKWRQYASIHEVTLEMELVGDACDVILLGIPEGQIQPKDAPAPTVLPSSSAVKEVVVPHQLALPHRFQGSADFEKVLLDVSTDGMDLIGFALVTKGATAIRNASWKAAVDPEDINHVSIAIATTTFKNEDYIIPNIKMFHEGVLASGEPAAKGFQMLVVDNGQTLDVEALSEDGVSIFPNPNEGGSAGFARGMLEALKAEDDFTHVLLMDDDVRIFPESLIRTYNLLSLAKGSYKDAFINGAMLEMERPNKQFEDVSSVNADGRYLRLKGNLYMDVLEDAVANEVISVEVPNAYGAWWYSCIPMSAIRENGLPLPIFVRCDDVEYGIRCNPTYMTMNGICVWHTAFTHKFRAPVDCYQYVRNFMILNALHDVCSQNVFLARATRTIQLYLRAMAYETADLYVSGLEDYLKGPEWLADPSGEAIFKANNAMAEKLIPLEEAIAKASEEHPELADELSSFEVDSNILRADQKANMALTLFRTLPYDHHRLPVALIRHKPATAYYGGYTVFSPEQAATDVLIALDREGENAHVRIMDRDEWQSIHKRWRDAMADYRARGKEVAKAYRDALPDLTSKEYWRDHLGLEGK